MQAGNLVLFKNKLSIVVNIIDDKKIEITNEKLFNTNKSMKVPKKQISLVYDANIKNFDFLKEVISLEELYKKSDLLKNIEEIWQMLDEEQEEITLLELCELIFYEISIIKIWQTYILFEDHLYFTGDIFKISTNNIETINNIKREREEKKIKQIKFDNFINRLFENRFINEDILFLKQVEDFALCKIDKCEILKILKIEETPSKAHKLLLDIKYWNEWINPYPIREKLSLDEIDFNENDYKINDDNRVDLKHFKSYAIDNINAKDPDDAISIDDDNRIYIHIADVSAIVTPDSILDIEARNRVSNIYLPEKTINMLPFKITEILGLGLNETSRALTISFDFNNDELENIEIYPSYVKVEMISYEKSNILIQTKNEYFLKLVSYANKFESLRLRNNAINFKIPEINVSVDIEKKIIDITTLKALKSRDMVKEYMLMAGIAIAKFAKLNNIPMAFSTQQVMPFYDDKKYHLKLENLSDSFAIRKNLRKSQYKVSSEPHEGLGLSAYIQATSPLRRYLDLVSHQQIRAFLNNENLLSDDEILERLSSVENLQRVIKKVQNNSKKHWVLVYALLNKDTWKGKTYLVDQKQKNRFLCFIKDFGIEKTMQVSPDYHLDDEIYLKVSSVNLSNLNIYFDEIWVNIFVDND